MIFGMHVLANSDRNRINCLSVIILCFEFLFLFRPTQEEQS